MILQTLYQQGIKHNVNFFDEHFTCSIILVQRRRPRLRRRRPGDPHRRNPHHPRQSRALVATGGFGRIFSVTSNAMAGTGDGVAIPYRRGVPLMDMEFYQFHPTGIYKLGILLSEAARGEGGILRNS